MSPPEPRAIPFGRPIIGQPELDAVAEVLRGGMLVHGPRTKAFEAGFAAFTGSANAVSVASCTAGMHLVYYALGLGPGDEVIVPAQTHVATAHAVALTGATPVFVDAEADTGNIDLDALPAAVTDRTRAIAVVHFLGYPVRMDRVRAIADPRGLFVMEDAALAVGTQYAGAHAGTLGDAGAFSFYPVKHLTTAEGGMVLVRDGSLAERLRRLRAFGLDQTVDRRPEPGIYDVIELGFNYRMNEIEAAIGGAQLARMPGVLEQRRKNYDALASALTGLDAITILPERAGAREPDCVNSCYCLSVVLDDTLATRRREVVRQLKARGIGTSVYYPCPVPLMTYYRDRFGATAGQFPVASWISACSISLPVGAHLTEDDMAHVAAPVRDVLAEAL